MKIITKLLHILFPVTCIVCSTGTIDLCQKCKENFYRSERDIPDWITAVWSYKNIGMHDIIVHIKKFPNVRLLSFLVSDIYNYLIYDLKQKNIILHKPIIIPVPITKNRYYERGYNQAELLAKQLSECMRIPMEKDVLYRIKKTRPLKEMNGEQRHRNLKGAFAVSKSWNPRQNILLIDDIYTTGSTIERAAGILKKAGVENVYFLTLSFGQGI